MYERRRPSPAKQDLLWNYPTSDLQGQNIPALDNMAMHGMALLRGGGHPYSMASCPISDCWRPPIFQPRYKSAWSAKAPYMPTARPFLLRHLLRSERPSFHQTFAREIVSKFHTPAPQAHIVCQRGIIAIALILPNCSLILA